MGIPLLNDILIIFGLSIGVLYICNRLRVPTIVGFLLTGIFVIGFGVNGRNVTRAARAAGIPYVIIEMNPETVRNEKSKEEPIYYGDATQEAILEHADTVDARVVSWPLMIQQQLEGLLKSL